MKYFNGFCISLFLIAFLVACNVSPSSPGGKLGSKNYNGNYTMGATSGTAYVYLTATGDTTIDLRYSLDSAPAVTITGIGFTDQSGSYALYKTDAIGTISGSTTSNFGTLSFTYTTVGNTLGFTGTKIQ